MKHERVNIEIAGISLIAAFRKGRHRGRLHSKIIGEIYQTDGESLEEVVRDLKEKLYSEEVQNFVADTLRQIHRSKLEEYARNNRSEFHYANPVRTESKRYQNHCWSCKKHVDNLIDLSCRICGWVICSRDAECGCGYKNQKNESN